MIWFFQEKQVTEIENQVMNGRIWFYIKDDGATSQYANELTKNNEFSSEIDVL